MEEVMLEEFTSSYHASRHIKINSVPSRLQIISDQEVQEKSDEFNYNAYPAEYIAHFYMTLSWLL
jgi:hypothetical protein